ncbi:MAG: hypothetical protein OJF49_002624 [Ktedonobacterales bacterium]|nr:MAG: hypothetical protein OJF49_002624 [Ktedonobacterales bacterium]
MTLAAINGRRTIGGTAGLGAALVVGVFVRVAGFLTHVGCVLVAGVLWWLACGQCEGAHIKGIVPCRTRGHGEDCASAMIGRSTIAARHECQNEWSGRNGRSCVDGQLPILPIFRSGQYGRFVRLGGGK